MKPPSLTRSILTAWLIAGTMDITAACIQYYIRTGNGPEGVLRFVASGALGKNAFTGGTEMPVLGLLFHYLVAFIFTIIFFWFYPRLKVMQGNKWITGLVYGMIVWAVMNLLVLPLSAAPAIPFVLKKAAVAMLILMCCIGLPISLIANKHYLYKK